MVSRRPSVENDIPPRQAGDEPEQDEAKPSDMLIEEQQLLLPKRMPSQEADGREALHAHLTTSDQGPRDDEQRRRPLEPAMIADAKRARLDRTSCSAKEVGSSSGYSASGQQAAGAPTDHGVIGSMGYFVCEEPFDCDKYIDPV